jgi:hypothetical protein
LPRCSDRNWLEFLSVLKATFSDVTGREEKPSEEASEATRKKIQEARELFAKVVEKDGLKDRSGLLAQLELEKRSRAHGLTDSKWYFPFITDLLFNWKNIRSGQTRFSSRGVLREVRLQAILL